MAEQLRERIAEILQNSAGSAQEPGEAAQASGHWLPLVTLESGAQLGLDQEGRWVAQLADAAELKAFAAGTEPLFAEAVETPRDGFEERLAEGARAVGLDPQLVVVSFPAPELVRDLLTRPSVHYIRLGLSWLLPSELRGLRAEIAAVGANKLLPKAVRALAGRLTVPE